jgi:hypothetical protein
VDDRLDRPRERRGRAPGVDRAADAVELIGRRLVQAGRHQQPVERELDVVAARALVPDRQAELLLDRRPRMKARVVPRAEQMRAPEVGEVLAQRPRRRHQVLVVARPVRLEPVAVVVGLELAQELERFGREAPERRHRARLRHHHGAMVTGPCTVWSSSPHCVVPRCEDVEPSRH